MEGVVFVWSLHKCLTRSGVSTMQGDLVMISEQNIDTPIYGNTNPWSLAVGPDICTNVQTGLDHEWLVTNGLGGYAAGSISSPVYTLVQISGPTARQIGR